MKRLFLPVIALAFVLGACERHSWEETKVLYEEHGEHADGEKHAEGEKHEGGEKHADPQKHVEGEKKEGEKHP